ncbi:HD family phosphohydrolase [Bacillus fonticola]|uniref:HD family phosphohydrolase n=1 Tax=Bacillus fonticola TaxID=2728853 RepID=UPI001D145507|nr:HD family phosphohydrolase [Bacillus fonticola]
MESFYQFIQRVKYLFQGSIAQLFLYVGLGVLLVVLLFPHVRPDDLNIEMYNPSPETIRSPSTIEDVESTEKRREEARKRVQDVYIVRLEYTQNRIDLITSIFQTVEEIERAETEDEGNGNSTTTRTSLSIADKLDALKEELTPEVADEIDEQTLRILLQTNEQERSVMQDVTVTAVNSVMTQEISSSEVEEAKQRVEDQLRFSSLPSSRKEASIELGRFAIVQNKFYDPTQTDELREEAVNLVEPVQILEGQVIVEQGDLVTRDVYRQLDVAGLLQEDQSTKPLIGTFLFVALVLGGFFFHTKKGIADHSHRANHLVLFAFVFLLFVGLMKGFTLLTDVTMPTIAFLFPAALTPMLLTVLLGEKIAFGSSLVQALLASMFFSENVSSNFSAISLLFVLISGVVAVLSLRRGTMKANVFQTGFIVAMVGIVFQLSVTLLRSGSLFDEELGFSLLFTILSGVLSSILVVGLLPIFESGFGILSTMKLIELSNPNHPLLKKLLTETPGTYHHSVMVANLSEAACETVGANGLLARVACYYHDVGKTVRPHFFIENQMNGRNPHDELTPSRSKDIIIAHTTDGARLLKQYKLPKEVVDIAKEHHGTSSVKYFYHQAKEKDENVKEASFRYPGPKPQTREAAVISIADSVEAATRSMKSPTEEKIECLVDSIVKERLQDGQFDECELTMQQLQTVKKSLCDTLKGMFHTRIEYPEDREKEKNS